MPSARHSRRHRRIWSPVNLLVEVQRAVEELGREGISRDHVLRHADEHDRRNDDSTEEAREISHCG
jgi:hypothetical protein